MVIHVFLILGYNYAEAGNPLPIIINTFYLKRQICSAFLYVYAQRHYPLDAKVFLGKKQD
jgi:hypothetical protein